MWVCLQETHQQRALVRIGGSLRFFIHYVRLPSAAFELELIRAPSYAGSGFGHPYAAVVLPHSTTKLFLAAALGINWKAPTLEAKDVMTFKEVIVMFADRSVYVFDKSVETQTLIDRELNKSLLARTPSIRRSQ
jgi:hypothetical protein